MAEQVLLFDIRILDFDKTVSQIIYSMLNQRKSELFKATLVNTTWHNFDGSKPICHCILYSVDDRCNNNNNYDIQWNTIWKFGQTRGWETPVFMFTDFCS